MARKTVSRKRELVITRIFDAPRRLVWKAWTEPEQVKKWWGPKDFTAPAIKIDLRIGGKYLYCMRGQAGPGAPVRDYWSGGVYREIIPEERMVVTDYFTDKDGNRVPATYYGMDADFPKEMLVTVTFEEHAGGTRLSLKYHDVSGLSARHLSDMTQGWNQSLDKLAESLRVPMRA